MLCSPAFARFGGRNNEKLIAADPTALFVNNLMGAILVLALLGRMVYLYFRSQSANGKGSQDYVKASVIVGGAPTRASNAKPVSGTMTCLTTLVCAHSS